MSDENKILWDTTEYPTEYPEEVKSIYFEQSLTNRKPFSEWIGKAGKTFKKDIDWWSSSPVSRNPYVSDLFHFVCIIETLKQLKKKYLEFKIYVNSNSLKLIIEKILKNRNHKVYLKSNRTFLTKYLNIIKSSFFMLFLFCLVKVTTKKRNFNTDNEKKILIDTFTFDQMERGERIYKELDKIVNNKTNNEIFFVPTILPNKNFFRVIKMISIIKKRKYLFKEHYINFSDLIFALLHFARVRKFLIKYDTYKNEDLSRLIVDEIYLGRDYYSVIVSILNFKFAKSLSEKKIKLKKTINWFENQTIDKGWNFGFRKYYPNISTQGYQGFLYFGQYLNQTPSIAECKSQVVPEKIIVNSSLFIKPRKEFFSKLNVKVGPTLSYNLNDINKKFKKKKSVNFLLVLSGISILDQKLIKWTLFTLKNNKNFSIIIKPHPILPMRKYLNKLVINYRNQVKISYENLSDLLKKTRVSICSGPTSGTLESIAYKCFLICPILEIYDEVNLKILKIPKKNYKLIYNKYDLSNIIKNLLEKKNITLRTKKISLKKATVKNIKSFLNSR